jgi:hypothetical protein
VRGTENDPAEVELATTSSVASKETSTPSPGAKPVPFTTTTDVGERFGGSVRVLDRVSGRSEGAENERVEACGGGSGIALVASPPAGEWGRRVDADAKSGA